MPNSPLRTVKVEAKDSESLMARRRLVSGCPWTLGEEDFRSII